MCTKFQVCNIFSSVVFAEKCHENWSDTFFKKFCWLEFSRYLKNTPFRPAHMSKVSWKKNSWNSDWPVFWKRFPIAKTPFCWYHENPMKTDHENYIQGSTHVVPNFLWKHFFDISCSFPVISFQIRGRKIKIRRRRRRKRRITRTTPYGKLLIIIIPKTIVFTMWMVNPNNNNTDKNKSLHHCDGES